MAKKNQYFGENRRSVFLLIVGIIVFGAAAFSLDQVMVDHVNKKYRSYAGVMLENVRKIATGTVEIWVNERIDDIDHLRQHPEVTDMMLELLQQPKNYDHIRKHPFQKDLRSFYTHMYSSNIYNGHFLLSTDYVVLAARELDTIGKISSIINTRKNLLDKVLDGSTVYIPPVLSKVTIQNNAGIMEKSLPMMFVARPVENASGSILGVFVLRIPVIGDFTKILDTAVSSNNGKTYLIDDQARILSFGFPEKLQARIPDTGKMTVAAKSVIQGYSDTNSLGYLDYHGKLVFGSWVWLKNLNMAIITEMDAGIYSEEMNESFLISRLVSASFILISFALFVLIVVLRKKGIRELKEREQLLDQTLQIAKVASWQWDFKSNHFTSWNLFDKHDEHIKKNYFPLREITHWVPQKEREEVKQAIEKLIKEKTAYTLDHQLCLDDTGECIDVRHEAQLVQFESGNEKLIGFIQDMSEIKQVQKQLLEQAEQSRLLLEHSVESIYGLDTNGTCTFVNQACVKSLGYDDASELIGKNMHDLIHYSHENGQEYPHSCCPILDGALKNEEIHNHKDLFWRKDGSDFPVEYWSAPIYRDNKAIGAVVAFVDITERIKFEKKLKQTNDLLEQTVKERTAELSILHQAIEQTESSILIMDQNTDIVYVNQAFQRNTGYVLDEIKGKNPGFLKSDYHSPKFYTAIRKCLLSGQPWFGEIATRKKDGTQFWESAAISPVKDDEGNTVRYVAVTEDITESKQIEKELNENKAKYQRIIEGTSDLITQVDNQGNFLFVNPVSERILGISTEECIGKSAFDFIHPDDREKTLEWFQSIVSSQKTYGTIENRQMNAKTGYSNHILWNVSFTYENGILQYSNSIGSNITERIQMEKELHNAVDQAKRANQAKSVFLANMSHEIRTPMNAILGFSELLMSSTLTEKQKGYLDSIYSSSRNLLRLINDILDLSKVEAGKMQIQTSHLNIRLMLHEIEMMFSKKIEEKELDFIIETTPDLPAVILIDEVRISQVMTNLIGNALKFTESGYVKLSVKSERVDLENNKINLIFSIEDTGIGIEPDQQELIFGTFNQQLKQSVKYGGTGLGLAISKRIVELLGGTISLDSQPGKGSKFIVRLVGVPLSTQKVSEQNRNVESESSIKFQKATILIVDDVATNRELIAEFLEPYNFKLIEARNGKEAVELAGSQGPDLILMDIRMPVMDGSEATDILKKNPETTEIPIIAVTASVLKSTETEIRNICDGYLRKPVSELDIINELTRFLPHQIIYPQNDSSEETGGEVKDNAGKMDSLLESPTSEFKEQLPELLEWIEENMDRWHKLKTTLHFNGIKQLAEEIQERGEILNFPEFVNWGEQLLQQMSNFELDSLKKSLNEYPEWLERLKQI